MMTNIYDISDIDPRDVYSNIIDEYDYPSFDDWLDRVEAQRTKLTYGLFSFKGSFYRAKFEKIDLTKKEHDEDINISTTTCRIIQFKWTYQFLK